ncbi:hypothetical protein D3C86_1755990 [compost metagenome]
MADGDRAPVHVRALHRDRRHQVGNGIDGVGPAAGVVAVVRVAVVAVVGGGAVVVAVVGERGGGAHGHHGHGGEQSLGKLRSEHVLLL